MTILYLLTSCQESCNILSTITFLKSALISPGLTCAPRHHSVAIGLMFLLFLTVAERPTRFGRRVGEQVQAVEWFVDRTRSSAR
jgi:hypothetical protein